MRVGIELEAKSPLSLGFMKPYEWYHRTLDFIPGSSFRGFVAEALIKECRLPDYKEDHENCPQKDSCRFYSLFYKDSPRFLPLYPFKRYKLPLPFPKSAMSCKSYGGFITQEKERRDEERHGVMDIIFTAISYSLLQNKLPISLNMHCPECKSPLAPFPGFFETTSFDTFAYLKPQVMQLTRTALNRKTATVEKEILYSIEAIRAGTEFYGEIEYSAPETLEILEEVFKNQIPFQARLGGGGTKGYGEVEVKNLEALPRYDFGSLSERLDSFNSQLNRVAKPYKELAGDDPISDWIYFPLDLLSDAILKDKMGAPTIQITKETLGEPFKELEVEDVIRFASPVTLSGWSTAWKLPKLVRLGVEKGSVFVFRAKSSEVLIQALSFLEQEGIGEGRQDGFGTIVVCLPFHFKMEVK